MAPTPELFNDQSLPADALIATFTVTRRVLNAGHMLQIVCCLPYERFEEFMKRL